MREERTQMRFPAFALGVESPRDGCSAPSELENKGLHPGPEMLIRQALEGAQDSPEPGTRWLGEHPGQGLRARHPSRSRVPSELGANG